MPSVCEMPRTDDRYQGLPYRHGYLICNRGMDGSSGTGHIDLQTGQLEVWAPGQGDGVQEAQFVPRSPDSPEGDGWLLVPVSRVSKMRSDLVILDAQNVAAGPVATLRSAGARARHVPRHPGSGSDFAHRSLTHISGRAPDM